MNFKRLTAAACIALSAIPAAAIADPAPATDQVSTTNEGPVNYLPVTTGELLSLIKTCQTDECMSYVAGAINGLASYAMVSRNPVPFCTNGQTDQEAVRRAIISTIETTPQLNEQTPGIAVLTSLARHWPCDDTASVKPLKTTPVTPIASAQVDALIASDGQALTYGDLDAPVEKTIRVFHDPNCHHCHRFSDELDILAERGWKVIIYPVATISKDSAGYAAVEIAMRDISQDAVRALHDYEAEDTADITAATRIAEEAGVPSRDILTAIATSGAYATVEGNTRAFFEMGGKGTPTWIVGTNLYGGFLNADALETTVASAEAETAAPSPEGKAPQASMEQ